MPSPPGSTSRKDVYKRQTREAPRKPGEKAAPTGGTRKKNRENVLVRYDSVTIPKQGALTLFIETHSKFLAGRKILINW